MGSIVGKAPHLKRHEGAKKLGQVEQVPPAFSAKDKIVKILDSVGLIGLFCNCSTTLF